MPPFGPTPSTTFTDFSVFNAQFPSEGAKVVPVVLNFSLQQSYSIDLTLMQQRGYIKSLQSVFVDNSNNGNASVSISVGGSNQLIVMPGNSQGIVPIFVPSNLTFTISTTGGGVVPIYFSNVPMPACVWSATQSPIYNGSGYMEVSDVALDALVSASGMQVIENVTDSNNVIKPLFKADVLYSGSVSAVTAQTIVTGAPSYFITDIDITLDPLATAGSAETITVTLKDGATTIATWPFFVPASAPTLTADSAVKIASMTNLNFNSKTSTVSLTLTLSAALTAGKLYWNIAGGLCSNIG